MKPSRPATRGYTIMEVTLVAFLSTILVVGVMRWLIGLGNVAGANLAGMENTTLARAVDAMSADILAARNCNDTGTGPVVTKVAASAGQTIDPPQISLYTSSNGNLKFVSWVIEEGSLKRIELDAQDRDCDEQEPLSNDPGWVTWAHDLDSQRSSFVLLREGAAYPGGTGAADCTHAWVTQCQVDAIDVTLSREGEALSTRRVITVE